eukprot:10451851-Lingulodinium_polyedra.AAC.1
MARPSASSRFDATTGAWQATRASTWAWQRARQPERRSPWEPPMARLLSTSTCRRSQGRAASASTGPSLRSTAS